LGRKGKILPALEEVSSEGEKKKVSARVETEDADDGKKKKKQREKLWILINDINI
jgi:hypothetical protein